MIKAAARVCVALHAPPPAPRPHRIHDREAKYYADGEDAFDMRKPFPGYKEKEKKKGGGGSEAAAAAAPAQQTAAPAASPQQPAAEGGGKSPGGSARKGGKKR